MKNRSKNRTIANMKYLLYRKVLSQQNFSAFQAMVNAGTSATLPTPLSSISVPAGYNTNYGIAFAQLVSALLQGINNYLSQILSDVSLNVANSAPQIFGQFPFGSPIQNAQQLIEDYGIGYDSYIQQCSELIQPAVFDETLFDLSAYQPAYGYQAQNNFCQQFEQQFAQLMAQVTQNNVAFDITTLGVGKTNIPSVENLMFNAIQNTGVGEALQQANINFYDLPDLAQYALTFLAMLNQVLSSGIALDASWFDRSAFSVNEGEYEQLANGFLLQNLSQWFGVVLDFTPLDFNVLMPEFPPEQETLEDLIATLTADKTLISIFAQLFAQHLYNPSPNGNSKYASTQAENYAEAYNMYLQINNIVKQRYADVMYARMVASATIEIARYTYRANLSYEAGARTLSYNEFLTYWRNKWSFYGLKAEDLQFAQQLGEKYQGASALQSQRKLQQMAGYVRTYKPLFYKKNYSGIS